jgi:hypothetical protein
MQTLCLLQVPAPLSTKSTLTTLALHHCHPLAATGIHGPQERRRLQLGAHTGIIHWDQPRAAEHQVFHRCAWQGCAGGCRMVVTALLCAVFGVHAVVCWNQQWQLLMQQPPSGCQLPALQPRTQGPCCMSAPAGEAAARRYELPAAAGAAAAEEVLASGVVSLPSLLAAAPSIAGLKVRFACSSAPSW